MELTFDRTEEILCDAQDRWDEGPEYLRGPEMKTLEDNEVMFYVDKHDGVWSIYWTNGHEAYEIAGGSHEVMVATLRDEINNVDEGQGETRRCK